MHVTEKISVSGIPIIATSESTESFISMTSALEFAKLIASSSLSVNNTETIADIAMLAE